MVSASLPIAITELRRHLEQTATHGRSGHAALPFGVAEVDAALPDGGLARGALHEIIEGGPASSFAAVASLFAAGIVARLPGTILWCLRSRDLFAPALSRCGLHPDRVIYLETWRDRDVLPGMEEGLRCRGLAAVVGEPTRLPLTASRQLQLAAEESGVMALVLRRWRTANERALTTEPNAARTRWQVSPAASTATAFEELDRSLWQVELLRVRGGEPKSWLLEACDASGHLALPAAVAVRPAAAKARRRTAAG